MEEPIESKSYFWDCLTLSKDCPFLSSVDPKLYYFGVGLLVLYGSFLLMILTDFNFFWPLDGLQKRIDYYINLVRKKIRHVQMDQRRLVSTQERSEKLLKRTEACKRMVTVLRGALSEEDPGRLSILTSNIDETICPSSDREMGNETGSDIDY